MEFDLGWILLGLPLAFVLGWLASRLDLRQLRFENRQAPKAYFRGLNFLLNEQQDQAIDAFIEAVQLDPDTTELHFALGNLFRRRGEYERAVRVHQHLVARGDLALHDRQRAQHALALDFLKAGLLDRAENALLPLLGTPLESQALLALLALFERARDWVRAAEMAQRLEALGQGSFAARRAHYLCEQATELARRPADSQPAAVERSLLEQALQTAPASARAYVALADWHRRVGDPASACRVLLQLVECVPDAVPLVAGQLVGLQASAGADLPALLRHCYQVAPSLDVLQALVELRLQQGDSEGARQQYLQHLESNASLVVAARWIATERFEHEPSHPLIQRALERAVKPLNRYRCAACGFEAEQHFWQCPGCQSWDSFPVRRVEETHPPAGI